MVPDGDGLAEDAGFPDALSAAPLCGENGSVMLLVSAKESSWASCIDAILGIAGNAAQVDHGYVIGGTGAVTEDTFSHLEELTK